MIYICITTNIYQIKRNKKRSTQVIIHVEGEGTQAEPPAAPNTSAAAKPTASIVLVNGTNTSFDAYNINGNNYFKLRDIAKIVNGTEKQFEVEWNTEKKAINLISNNFFKLRDIASNMFKISVRVQ